jgi:transcriptional regulator with XRE-family HTH domain
MRTDEKSEAMQFLDEVAGGPLTFGRMLNSIRQGEEWSLVEMGKKLGVSPQHLCDIEKERRTVSPARAAEFARRLGLSEARFIRLALQAMLDAQDLHFSVDVHAA